MTSAPCQAAPELLAAVQRTREHFGFAKIEKALIRFTGPDALSFLQNRLSNDVSALKPGQGQLNAALDRQGKIQGVFDLYRAEDHLTMLIAPEEKENTISQIEKFHILEQYKVEDKSTDVAVWSLQGPRSTAYLTGLLKAGALPLNEFDWISTTLFEVEVQIAKRSLTGEDGFLLVVPQAQALPFESALRQAMDSEAAVELPPQALEVLRIEAGLPRFGKDYNFETLLPETGLEREAVSYTKGCYLGQETIARVKTYGTVQRALVGLLLDTKSPLPAEGEDCLINGKVVGQITSACYSPTLNRPIAMAYLGKTERVPGKRLTLEIAGQTYETEVTLLPFYTSQSTHQDGQALLKEGLKLFSDGYDEEAIRLIRKAVEAQPDLVEAYEALGVILSRHDRYDEAIQLMEKVLNLNPEHVLAHTNLSVYYMKLGDKEKAEEEKAKATMAAFSQKAKEAGLVFDIEAERKKKEQATLEKIAMFKEALKFNPDDPLGNFGLGSAYLELKRYAEAIEPFQKMLKTQPRHSVAYLSLAKCLEGNGQKSEAEQILKKGIEVAAAKGDLMPLKEMQARLDNLTP